jgi:dihydrodipicolinate synthase/N-acetylneuraminate lyase
VKDLSILLPVVTPCSTKGQLDLDGLRSVCTDMVNSGCTSIFVLGSSGRGPWFSRESRARICRTVADLFGDRIPLLAGCMASGLPQMLENAGVMADAGADMVVVTAPGYFRYNNPELETIFWSFADQSPLPVVVYDIPGLAGSKLDTEMILHLARHENVVGFKDSSADFDRFKSLLQRVSCTENFSILQGKERFLADSLLAGASGFVVSLLQIDPRPFVSLSRAARAGEVDRAQRIQVEVSKVMDLLEESLKRRPETSTLFHFLNWCLRERGICDNILLEHERSCPDWLAENARGAFEILRNAATI